MSASETVCPPPVKMGCTATVPPVASLTENPLSVVVPHAATVIPIVVCPERVTPARLFDPHAVSIKMP